MRLAVLGMRRIGRALAERLLAGGHVLTVWNRTPDKAGGLVAKGVRPAATPAEAAQTAEATFMSLADDDAVRAVVCGPDGAAAGIGDGILVDAGTVSPETSAQVARAVGGRFLAAPVLGAPAAVASGETIYVVGGPREPTSASVRPSRRSPTRVIVATSARTRRWRQPSRCYRTTCSCRLAAGRARAAPATAASTDLGEQPEHEPPGPPGR